MSNNYSPAAQTVCAVCDFIWSAAMIGGCAYLVFWRDVSGWWFLLAMLLASCWSCKSFGSPEQIRANAERDKESS